MPFDPPSLDVMRHLVQGLQRAAANHPHPAVAEQLQLLADSFTRDLAGAAVITSADDAFLLEHFGQGPPDMGTSQ